jgi:hypothetical protein
MIEVAVDSAQEDAVGLSVEGEADDLWDRPGETMIRECLQGFDKCR